MSHNPKVLLLMSGSVAVYKAAALVSQMVQKGFAVKVAATPNTWKFIGPATLEGISGQTVIDSIFEPGDVMGHIHWARWADLVVLCPATANTINKLASGIADDIVGTLYLALEKNKPFFIAPAMNSHMLSHPATVASLVKLESRGATILPTNEGPLACGEEGKGRLLEPEAILDQIEQSLQSLQSKAAITRGKVLVTSGGTRENIDGVRYIGNTSTGRTGATVADQLHKLGYEVTYLGAKEGIRPNAPIEIHTFCSFIDLDVSLKKLLGQQHYDGIVHAAAVSDFSVGDIFVGATAATDSVSKEKLPSEEEVTLKLIKNHKIISRLKDYSINKEIKIVGFKLTKTKEQENRRKSVEKLLEDPSIHCVVHNDMNDISTGRHSFTVYERHQEGKHCKNAVELAHTLGKQLEMRRKNHDIVLGRRQQSDSWRSL